jgi:hypothetical protein
MAKEPPLLQRYPLLNLQPTDSAIASRSRGFRRADLTQRNRNRNMSSCGIRVNSEITADFSYPLTHAGQSDTARRSRLHKTIKCGLGHSLSVVHYVKNNLRRTMRERDFSPFRSRMPR